ncbi:MAG TPA: haloacid dehalogenase-like hydrolase [Actinomycetes bacterium]|nr:haloacid dehalogenase-like hydrolase [Actinomycetes bacterium]
MTVPRLLDLDRAALAALSGRDLLAAVAAAEGRTVVAEVVAAGAPLAEPVDNVEVVAAMGADLLLLNRIEEAMADGGWRLPRLGRLADLSDLARRVGRPVGANLEPGDVPDPRRATPEAARVLIGSGAAFLCLTANPGTGTSLADLARATAAIRAALGPGPAIWAGKMHQAGATEPLTPGGVAALVDAGADAALVPLPGTVPGVTREAAAGIVQAVHAAGGLAVGTVGTSQEGAHPSLMDALGLVAKEIGVDLHHLGDAGLGGSPDPEVVYRYSVAIRGRRHTWRRMALGARGPHPDAR